MLFHICNMFGSYACSEVASWVCAEPGGQSGLWGGRLSRLMVSDPLSVTAADGCAGATCRVKQGRITGGGMGSSWDRGGEKGSWAPNSSPRHYYYYDYYYSTILLLLALIRLLLLLLFRAGLGTGIGKTFDLVRDCISEAPALTHTYIYIYMFMYIYIYMYICIRYIYIYIYICVYQEVPPILK